jgi:hypothetical protein
VVDENEIPCRDPAFGCLVKVRIQLNCCGAPSGNLKSIVVRRHLSCSESAILIGCSVKGMETPFPKPEVGRSNHPGATIFVNYFFVNYFAQFIWGNPAAQDLRLLPCGWDRGLQAETVVVRERKAGLAVLVAPPSASVKIFRILPSRGAASLSICRCATKGKAAPSRRQSASVSFTSFTVIYRVSGFMSVQNCTWSWAGLPPS